jgi:dTDP-glucose pyrophosphorylase
MQVVVPMAGLGVRFADAGYRLPKPLVEVSGRPMIAAAVAGLPDYDRLIFVCHPQHVEKFAIDRILQDRFPDCRVVTAPGSTAGQAASVRLAAAHLDLEDSVLVAACDNTHLYSREQWRRRIAEPSCSAFIWTYRRDARVLLNPRAHGWVEADDDGRVAGVSVKTPISDRPFYDHCISGCFWFRTARGMLAGIDDLIAADRRVNGEFYLDSVPGLLQEQGKRVEVFEVEKYVGWGTPEDLHDFHRWEEYFRGGRPVDTPPTAPSVPADVFVAR